MIEGRDPAVAYLAGAVDLRPGSGRPEPGQIAVVSGPDDLRELRSAVEAITGAGTWPYRATQPASGGARLTRVIEIDRLPPVLGLVAALEGPVQDRAGAWRTWRSVIDAVATAIAVPFSLTVDAVVLSGELAD